MIVAVLGILGGTPPSMKLTTEGRVRRQKETLVMLGDAVKYRIYLCL